MLEQVKGDKLLAARLLDIGKTTLYRKLKEYGEILRSAANLKSETQSATRVAALIVTAMDGIESQAAELAGRLHVTVEIASSRAAALRLLSRRGYAMVVVDQILADSDPEGCDLIWKNAGMAIPLQINFALAGSARLEREMRGGAGMPGTGAASGGCSRDGGPG